MEAKRAEPRRRVRVWLGRASFRGRSLPKTRRQRTSVCGECGAQTNWIEYASWMWVPYKTPNFEGFYRKAIKQIRADITRVYNQDSGAFLGLMKEAR